MTKKELEEELNLIEFEYNNQIEVFDDLDYLKKAHDFLNNNKAELRAIDHAKWLRVAHRINDLVMEKIIEHISDRKRKNRVKDDERIN